MKPTKIATSCLAALVLCSAPWAAEEPATRIDPAGFLYGTVRTEGGDEYTGLLRWGDEEAFWDDLFNSSKAELPYIERLPDSARRRREIRVFGIEVGYSWDEVSESRAFIARFGDIQELRVRRGEQVDVVMKSGTVVPVEGGSNDIGADVVVEDATLGRIEVEWDRIERITFGPAPRDARPAARRLHGKVTTNDGAFVGFIQWDSQECLSTDRLDGDGKDGKLSIEMGRIRSIEKRNDDGAWVELLDGRRIAIEGSNDVDESIRGILVEDARFGRVKISWDAFVRADFDAVDRSGRGYADYGRGKPLGGTVTDGAGKLGRGRLVFDLDETESWEMLNGDADGVEYEIPFERVRAIEPGARDASRVVLRDGTAIELEEAQDVASRNAGILVLDSTSKDGIYFAWGDVRRIEFD